MQQLTIDRLSKDTFVVSMGKTKGGAKLVRLCSPLFVVILVLAQRAHQEGINTDVRRIIRVFAAGLTQLQLFHILFGVLNVVGGIIRLAGAGGLDVSCGDAAPYLVRGYLGTLQNKGAGGDDGAFANLAVVEQGGTHANEGAVADGASMEGDVVADGDVAADMRGAGLMRYMYAGAVLHVGAVADCYWGHVATHHGVEPHRALVAQRHVAHQRSVLAEITVLAPTGRLAFV